MSSSSFTDSFDQIAGDSPAASTGPFDFAGDDSHQLNSSSFSYSDSPIFTPLQPIHVSADGRLGSSHPTDFTSPEPNDKPVDASDFASDGSILPPPDQMQSEEGFALREWRRLNSIRLEEKEKMEKELLSQISNEADEYKVKFHMRRKVTCETNKAANREKEKSFMASQEKFYTEVEKNYWKAIAELIPNEVPAIEKRGKKDQDKKPSVVVIQGPKPGKPTDMSRMRQLLLKLKHNAPTHLMPSPPPAPTLSKDTRTGDAPAVVTGPEAIAVV